MNIIAKSVFTIRKKDNISKTGEKILKKMFPKYLLEYYVLVREVHCHYSTSASKDILYVYILVGLRVKCEEIIFYTSVA